MDLSDELAQRCLQVKQAAAEEDPNRDEFEDLASRERVARSQAARYRDIAHGRAREEAEKTPAETFTGRLYPVPHTLGEAAWRVPATAAGGIAGYQAVAKHELPDQEAIRELLRPGKGEGATHSGFGVRLRERLTALGHSNPEGATTSVEALFRKNPELVHSVLSIRPNALISEKGQGIRQGITATVGSLEGRSAKSLVREILHDTSAKAKVGLGEGLSKWKRYGGAGLGALAAAVATGVPLGLNALRHRGAGGEAAVRAKARMQEELGKAEDATKQREAILARLGT